MIEDIAFLKENSVNDSIPFYIDSAARDVKIWPTPSEYSITFEQPFRFVYGFDILDAAIPTTQYNIEDYNNVFALTLFSEPTNNNIQSIDSYIHELAFTKHFIDVFEKKEETKVYIISPDTATTYNLRPLSNTLKTQGTDTYKHAFVRHTLNNVPITLKTNQSIDSSTSYVFVFNEKEYIISRTNTIAIDILRDGNYILQFAGNNSTLIFYEKLFIDDITFTLLNNIGEYIAKIVNHRIHITTGNYDISTLRNELNGIMNQYDLDFETTTPVETRQGRYKVSSSKNIIIINGQLTTMRDNIGLSVPPENSTSSFRKLKIGDNPLVFLSIYDSFFEVYKIEAPGLVNLFGERFVVLKIKEIEDHLLGSYGYMSFSPGIGMFKLASSFNDVTNLRFDYVSLVRKPFHPIGKVSKLTLRFETARGDLYDFKGVNHQLLMVIKFLVPTPKVDITTRSILNPNYDPDYIKYIARNQTIENKEESEEEEEFLDDLHMNRYKKELRSYRSSSSSEDNEEKQSTKSGNTSGNTTDNNSEYTDGDTSDDDTDNGTNDDNTTISLPALYAQRHANMMNYGIYR